MATDTEAKMEALEAAIVELRENDDERYRHVIARLDDMTKEKPRPPPLLRMVAELNPPLTKRDREVDDEARSVVARRREARFYNSQTVRLRAGGPLMTVEFGQLVHAPSEDGVFVGVALVHCIWFDGAELKRDTFATSVLQNADQAAAFDEHARARAPRAPESKSE